MARWTQAQIDRKVKELVAAAADSLRRRDGELRIAADGRRPEYERAAARQAAGHFDMHRLGCLAHADALERGEDPASLGY